MAAAGAGGGAVPVGAAGPRPARPPPRRCRGGEGAGRELRLLLLLPLLRGAGAAAVAGAGAGRGTSVTAEPSPAAGEGAKRGARPRPHAALPMCGKAAEAPVAPGLSTGGRAGLPRARRGETFSGCRSAPSSHSRNLSLSSAFPWYRRGAGRSGAPAVPRCMQPRNRLSSVPQLTWSSLSGVSRKLNAHPRS